MLDVPLSRGEQHLGLAACAALFLVWVAPLVTRPILADEVLIVANAMEPVNTGPLSTGHPPLHVDTMRVAGRLFGWRLEAFHWYGVGCALISLGLVVWLARLLHPQAGLLAGVAWTLHPMVMQGSVIVDIDNTVLPVCMTGWTILWLKRSWPWRRADVWWMGVACFLCLWAKVTTSLILPVAVAAEGFSRGQGRAGLRAALGMAAIAAVLFAAGWWWYVWRYDFPTLRVWEHLTSKFGQGLGGEWLSGASEILNRIVRIALWFNPVFLGLTALAGWRLWRGQAALAKPAHLALWWIIGLLGIGYVAVRGLHFGFAKYHFPLLPLMVALVSAVCLHAGFPLTRRHWLWLAAWSSIVALYEAVAAGDVLYLANYTWRHALLFAPEERSAVMQQLLLRLAAGIAPIAILGAIGWRWQPRGLPRAAVWPAVGLVTFLGSSLALDGWQRTTAYSTTYNYGRSIPQMRALIDWMAAHRRRYPTGYWLAPEDVMLYVGLTYTGGYGPWWRAPFWNNPEVVAEGLRDPRTHGLVISPTYHSAWTHQQVFAHPAVRTLLERDYRAYRLGEYTIWIRQGEAVPAGVS